MSWIISIVLALGLLVIYILVVIGLTMLKDKYFRRTESFDMFMLFFAVLLVGLLTFIIHIEKYGYTEHQNTTEAQNGPVPKELIDNE